jgi:hypothetical protein
VPLTEDINFLLLCLGCGCSGAETFSRQTLVPGSSIDAQYTSNVIPVPRNREFAVCIPPLIQEVTNCFANLILAVLAVVTSTSDGIDRPGFFLVLEKHLFEIFDSFFGMQAMEINIELGARGAVLVTLFVKLTSSLSMSFSHRVILALTTKAQGFRSPCIVAIPGLSGAGLR